MTTQPSIFADTESDNAVLVRVEAKGEFTNAPCLREFAEKMIAAGRREFIVDLKNCPSMDSTFMGMLAGITQRLTAAGGGKLWVINRNHRNTELLDDLGFTALFEEGPAPACGTSAVPLDFIADKATTREVMIEAHEACIQANPSNAAKFKDVLEHLADSARRAK